MKQKNQNTTWLVRLRWCAVFGQSSLIALADWVYHIDIPYPSLWLLVGVVSFSNILLLFRSRTRDVDQDSALLGSILILDTIVLTLLLGYSGGPANPFSVFYLLHISMASLLMGLRWTWCICCLSIGLFASLFWCHTPVPIFQVHHSSGGSLHFVGMWGAFSLVSLLSGYFGSQLKRTLALKEQEIARIKLCSAEQERLASLTTLAAGAAHELASPLATSLLAATEMLKAIDSDRFKLNDGLTDLRLIVEQLGRCRTILSHMGEQLAKEPIEELEDISSLGLFALLRKEMLPAERERLVLESGYTGVITIPAQSTVKALVILIKNGLEASSPEEQVGISMELNSSRLKINVRDYGDGMNDQTLGRLGEPFFSRKEAGEGMGLGIFLARLIIHRLGGTLRHHSEEGIGTLATVDIPTIQNAAS